MKGYYLVTHPKTKHKEIYSCNLEGLKNAQAYCEQIMRELNIDKVTIEYSEKKPKIEGNYRIYFSSASGLDFTGVTADTEEKAIEYCEQYDKNRDTKYGHHTYRKL